MLWDGRFSKNLDKKVLNFTSSLNIDKNLYKYDIKGSLVHIETLNKIGIIRDEELKIISDGLNKILTEFNENKFVFIENDEDIHMAIERRLIELIGEVGKKLHTGRSRNDQINLDTRLYIKDQELIIIEKINEFIKVLVKIAEKNIDVIMPGYTHLQQAQPILFSHYLLSFAHKFFRDRARFLNAYNLADIYPLGAGALSGTPYDIDRKFAAIKLGFSNISQNSLDIVSDRDFILDFLYAASSFAVNSSRLAEDFIIYSSQEFNFLELNDAFTTGSSLMPQKKNPDVLELIRGKSQRIIGSLNAFINVIKALPMTYNRDLQEDKFYLFNTVDTILEFLGILPIVISTTKINCIVMEKTIKKSFIFATNIADYLVKKDIPFREAHNITGKIVSFCINKNKTFFDLTIDEFKQFSDKFDLDIFDTLDAKKIIDKQVIQGSTSTNSVKEQIKYFNSMFLNA